LQSVKLNPIQRYSVDEDKASPTEIARKNEDLIIRSIKSGRVRKAVQEAVAGR
jgi:hypothetical protein